MFGTPAVSVEQQSLYLPKERRTFKVVFEMIGELTASFATGFLHDNALKLNQSIIVNAQKCFIFVSFFLGGGGHRPKCPIDQPPLLR